MILSQSLRVLYINSCPDQYDKKLPIIQSVVYCFGCEEKGRERTVKMWQVSGVDFLFSGYFVMKGI